MKRVYHWKLVIVSLFVVLTEPVLSQDTLSLEDAIIMGLENNFGIRVAKNDVLIAKNNNTLGNAGFLPSMSANLGGNLNILNSDKTLKTGETESADQNTLTKYGSIQLNWTLFDGMAMFISKEQLSNLQKMGELKLRLSVEDAVGSVIIIYHEIIQQQKQINSLEKSLTLSRERLRIAKEKSKIGAGYQLLEIQADVDLHADSSNLLKQQNVLQNLLVELNSLLGRDPGVKYNIREIPMTFSSLNVESVLEGLNSENAELLYDRLNLENKSLAVKSYKSGRYPYLNFSSSYNLYDYQYSTGVYEKQKNQYPVFGLTAGINLFDGFNLNRSIRNAKIQYESQQLLYSQKENMLKSYVIRFLNDFNLAVSLVKTEEVSMRLATQNLSIAMEKYRLGAISDFELREIQKKLLDAQYRYYTAQLQAKTAEVELKILSGVLLKEIKATQVYF